MTAPNVTFRAANGLADELAARGTSLSAVAYRDLRRYYDLMRELDGVARDLRMGDVDPEWLTYHCQQIAMDAIRADRATKERTQ